MSRLKVEGVEGVDISALLGVNILPLLLLLFRFQEGRSKDWMYHLEDDNLQFQQEHAGK